MISWREEEMVVAASPLHPLALEGEAITAARLNGLDFIGFDEDLPIRRHLDRFLKDLGAEVNITLHFDNLQMIKEAVAHRVGISIMPARLMMDDIAQGRLVAIRIEGAVLFRPLGIIHRKKKRFNRVAQAFLELLCEKPGPDYSLASNPRFAAFDLLYKPKLLQRRPRLVTLFIVRHRTRALVRSPSATPNGGSPTVNTDFNFARSSVVTPLKLLSFMKASAHCGTLVGTPTTWTSLFHL